MITSQDMIDRFGKFELAELTNRDTRDDIDDVVLKQAIEDASEEARSYLLPVGLAGITPPKSLKLKVCDIARYYLHEDSITEIVETRYKRAIDWLKEVQKKPSMLADLHDNAGKQKARFITMVRG